MHPCEKLESSVTYWPNKGYSLTFLFISKIKLYKKKKYKLSSGFLNAILKGYCHLWDRNLVFHEFQRHCTSLANSICRRQGTNLWRNLILKMWNKIPLPKSTDGLVNWDFCCPCQRKWGLTVYEISSTHDCPSRQSSPCVYVYKYLHTHHLTPRQSYNHTNGFLI